MNRRRIAVPVALALAVVSVPAAQAALPTPPATAIVPGKSVAGVRLGMALSVAKTVWGAGSTCGASAAGPAAVTCTWSSTPNARPDRGPKLILVGIGGKVRSIVVDGGNKAAAVAAYRTTKGIGTGSTVAALRKAYPGLGTALGPDNPSLGSGATITSFHTAGGKVRSIQVGSPY